MLDNLWWAIPAIILGVVIVVALTDMVCHPYVGKLELGV